ncbi:uncharacterized protein AB675_7406 [Cyphellophora attinorum]|uniref:Uncharacterized protein n=1 Tax=Cyphellophora attinorum TaxID=1664694 RepID=A0A0N1H2I6_9EURO|nr:uncharacterized protein AB675_7406 [Phialophora attinorum]KPI34547.1 hypothetical protein AB675_7406 [Phialophora attinorum]
MPPSLFNNLAYSLSETELHLVTQRQRFAELQARYDALTTISCSSSSAASFVPDGANVTECRVSSEAKAAMGEPDTALSTMTVFARHAQLIDLGSTLSENIKAGKKRIRDEQELLARHEHALSRVMLAQERLETHISRNAAEVRMLEKQMEDLQDEIVGADGDVQGFRVLARKILRRAGTYASSSSGGRANIARGECRTGGAAAPGNTITGEAIENLRSSSDHSEARARRRDLRGRFSRRSSSVTTVATHLTINSTDSGRSTTPSSPDLVTVQMLRETRRPLRVVKNFELIVPLKRSLTTVETCNDGSRDDEGRTGRRPNQRADEGISAGVKRSRFFRRCVARESIELD